MIKNSLLRLPRALRHKPLRLHFFPSQSPGVSGHENFFIVQIFSCSRRFACPALVLFLAAAWLFATPAFANPTGNPVYLTNAIFYRSPAQGSMVRFDLAGGDSSAVYNILETTNLNVPGWTWLAQGYPGHTYNFIHQADAGALFSLGQTPVSMVVAWGNDGLGQCDVPPGLSNAVAVAGGVGFSLALRGDGTVLAWGDDNYGQTNVPGGINNAVAIAAGPYHALALEADGTVVAWGDWWNGSSFLTATVPPGLTNLVAIAAGAEHDLALRADGSVVAWGSGSASYDTVPTNQLAASAVAAGWYHDATLLTNAGIFAWGANSTNPGMNLAGVPVDFTNSVAISATALHTLGLHRDGTVEAWGDNSHGQLNVPAGLTNVVSVAAGQTCSLALTQDGTVTVWGDFGAAGASFVPYGLAGVNAIGPGASHCLAVCTTHLAPVITVQPVASQTVFVGGSVTLMVKSQALGSVNYQWQVNSTNISGATNSLLTLTNFQSGSQGDYDVVVSGAYGSSTSSNAVLRVAPLPPPLVTAWTAPWRQWANAQSNVVLGLAVTNPPNAPLPSCTWQFNGTNIYPDMTSPYGYQIFSLTGGQEGTYSATVSNATGTRSFNWSVHAAFPGGVALWGADDYGQADRPANCTSNVIAVAGGLSNSLALMANGTVTQWGLTWASVPANLTNATAIASGSSHMLALKSDGTVVSWGSPADQANFVPANLTGVQAIAAGWYHNAALLSNGTVTAWGLDGAILGWHLTEVPIGLTNVTAIAAGSMHSLALLANGTVVAWGYSPQGETAVPPGLSNVVAIAAGGQHSLALKADGTVVAWGFDGYGQCDVPAGLNNVTAIAAGWGHSVALKNDGTVVAWGDDSEGQIEIATNLVGVKSIAAGGYHTLAAMYSPLLKYPVTAANDLLLVYNTNAADSATVLNYYLQNRPLAGTANVLGIGCTNAEMILPSDYTNEIAAPLATWLAAHPTKRPGYVVLFLDIPSRVGNPTNSANMQPSVSYQIATGFGVWQPLVTHINMGDTNACIAYINKLAAMGSVYSPGQLLISAGGATGYGDANYVIDNIRHGSGYMDNYTAAWWFGSGATNGLLQSGVPYANILYTNGTEITTNGTNYNLAHLTNAANVAGYMSWGGHSSLGEDYAVDGVLRWTGRSTWYVISTIESFNGDINESGMGNFIQWFSPNAFGGVNYANTPVGGITHVEEPGLPGDDNMQAYFGLWSAGLNFATCAWQARNTPYYMVVGDPLVSR
jgi:alpha-tubulin suppressor-like RCC1 family protein